MWIIRAYPINSHYMVFSRKDENDVGHTNYNACSCFFIIFTHGHKHSGSNYIFLRDELKLTHRSVDDASILHFAY